jgi:anti-sigma regulatory factor (Ser/Thr protein kinase)
MMLAPQQQPRPGCVFELTVPSEGCFLVVVRKVVAQFAEQAGFTEEEANHVVVAVDEGCTNIIRHGYGSRPGRRIRIRCEAERDGLNVRLRDYGGPVDLEHIRTPDEAGAEPGGLGLRIMRSAMDRVEYVSGRGIGLEVNMFKRYPG